MREKSLNNKIYVIAMTDIWLNYKELKVLFCNERGIFCLTRCAAMLIGWGFLCKTSRQKGSDRGEFILCLHL